MKNTYHINGDEVIINIKSSKYGEFKVLISTNDLERAKEIDGYWFVAYDKCIDGFYIRGNTKDAYGKWHKVRLHRWLLYVTDSQIQVDHRNHDTLDNRRKKY